MLIYSGKITKNVNPIKPRKKDTKCSQKVEKKESKPVKKTTSKKTKEVAKEN